VLDTNAAQEGLMLVSTIINLAHFLRVTNSDEEPDS
jgi:hypothetical protein